MTLPKLISFSGYPDAGKDSAADLLVQRARFVKTYTAKPLEQALVKLNPWIVDHGQGTIERFEDLYDNLGQQSIKDFEEIRRLLRILETNIGRDRGQNIWTSQLFAEVRELLDLGKSVALSGVQYPEELALVREHDGVCVWVNRIVKPRSHVGTIRAEDCDLVVHNDGSLKTFYVNIITALEAYNQEKTNVG